MPTGDVPTYFNPNLPNYGAPCPSCGACPHCGRGPQWPMYPAPIWPSQPWPGGWWGIYPPTFTPVVTSTTFTVSNGDESVQ